MKYRVMATLFNLSDWLCGLYTRTEIAPASDGRGWVVRPAKCRPVRRLLFEAGHVAGELGWRLRDRDAS